MPYTGLILFIFLAWLLHCTLFINYRKKFKSTKSWSFRMVHTTEIFIVTASTMTIYLQTVDQKAGLTAGVLTTLGTLMFLDGTLLLILKKLRGTFDIYHFLAAYLAVGTAVSLFLME